ncbi:Echinoderm microtubule-associated protein [Phytophthora megakarya]|uniref:Echinoderm microtubule-associated protein n=1 Tax=Phytophthora megakarya TaxID=4795 RepID=A0A225W5I5_9STRA|nr:Echinoderm microtubule-associated protein [Phytophthora megakarya]
MGVAHGTQFRLVDTEVELRRETRDFARWTLSDVEELHRHFKKTFGFAVTASQFESLLLLKTPENIGVEEIFEVLDSNRDGRVDGLELLAALACVCRAKFEDKARFAFDLFDFNHNGSLSLAELALLMKSVLIGMTLLTGGHGSSAAYAAPPSSMEAMMICLGLAENAFMRMDKATSALSFDDFIAWARSNREFMLQVERFRLIGEKAVGFEDALSLPDGSDIDSDLDVEDLAKSDKGQGAEGELQLGTQKTIDNSPPWMVEPRSHPPTNTTCKKNGMLPPANLQLEWVYGTNGPSARNACRLLATGEAVYFVGSYVVLYSSERHEQRYYRGHRRAIGCLAVNATSEIVATGDACVASTPSTKRGAEIHIWTARSLQCLAVLRNFHPAGVAHLSFPAAVSAATATIRQTQVLSLGERGGAGGKSSAVLSSNLMKKKPQETEALIASIGCEDGASMALWNWQQETVVASGRAHPTASGRRATTRGCSKRPLAIALNEDGDEIVVVGAHFVVFHQVGGRFFKHKKPHWNETVDPPLYTVPACLSVVYYGIQSVVVGTAHGELLLFERHVLTRCVQAHDTQTSVNVCLLSCQSMVLFSAGKDGQIKQWDSTLRPIGQSLDLHALLPVPQETLSISLSNIIKPESVLEGDDFRLCSLDYDAQRKRFLVATRKGNIFEINDDTMSTNETMTSTNNIFRWKMIAAGHTGQPTCRIATASTVGGCFASCGVGEHFVMIWSLRRRAFVQYLRFPGATAAPSALEFSSNGERLAIGSEDGTLMIARRTGAASSSVMKIEATMKNTSSAVVAMRFGPLKTEPLIAVTRGNGLIYLYRLHLGSQRFSRYMLLKPQGDSAGSNSENTQAHALDFSVDGAFLRTQHGKSVLYFWDLRQRSGTRITSMSILRNIQWHTHSTSIGWDVGGLPQSENDSGDCVVANTRGLTLVINHDGDINLAPIPCPPQSSTTVDSSENCWLSRCVTQAHLTKQVSIFDKPSGHPPIFGDFALRGTMLITSSQYDPAICQWRVEKELKDVQPRSPCPYDQTLRKRVQALGLKDRSEAPDVALTISYVFGFNHRCMSLNQSLACLGNGFYIYAAGPLLIVRHLHAFGTRQRIVTSGLQHSVSCLVKHPSEAVLAVGSRKDDRVVLLRTEKSTTAADSFQQVTTLKASLIPSTISKEQNTVITLDFCDSNNSNTRNVQSDLAAVIWKNSRSHVHTLVFYAWKRQLLLAHAPMTRMPVLFGKFAGSSDTGVNFVSGGVDHVTFWLLNPSTGHVTAQQGVFGRHALVQTMTCAVHVAPFVITGGEDDSIVLWDSSAAAHTIISPAHSIISPGSSSGGNRVVALQHLQASQIVLGALRRGSLVVWKYTVAHSPTRGTKTPGGRIHANSFLQLVRTITVYNATKPTSNSTLSPLFNVTNPSNSPNHDTYVQGMNVLDDSAVAAVILNTGELLSVDLESIIDASTTKDQNTGATTETNEKAKTLMNFSSEINDIALHPRDFRWASASADRHICVWNLNTNLLSHQQTMPSTPKALAWSATGDHLAVSLSNGIIAILDGITLELLLQFPCGDSEKSSSGQLRSTSLAKWCTLVKYSLLHHQAGLSIRRNWLALGCRDYNIYVYAWEISGTEGSPPVYSLRHTFVGHTAPIKALDFSMNSEFLQSATSSNDRQLLRWALDKEASSNESSGSATDAAPAWDLLDDEWATWTSTFAGPVEGLAECCGVGKTTALGRINHEITKDSNDVSSTTNWKSPLPIVAVGLDDGHVMLAWYPLTRGDVAAPVFTAESESSSDPAVVTKEYMGCFSRRSLICRVEFSFTNAFVVALARNSNGSTQVTVWKTDYDDELRLRQRFALKSAVSLDFCPTWYLSPVDRTLLEECIRVQRNKEPIPTTFQPRQEFEDENCPVGLDKQSNDDDLCLEFIYGLNPGATGSRNIFYADDAWEIVYAAGACGVVYNTKTQTQLLNYNSEAGHHSVISALAVHPKGDLVASGECLVTAPWVSSMERAPEIVIWDANSGSTIFRVVSKHRPGILLLEFSPDGHRLASIGMEADHTLVIYMISGHGNEGGRLRTTLLVACKTSTRRVWGLSFGEDGEVAICGDQHILFWHQDTTNTGRGDDDTHPIGLKSGLLTSHKECHPQATLLQIAHMSGRARVVVSSQADGSLYVWKDRICVIVRREAHGDAPIPALAVDKKQSLLYSAGADSRICAWTAQLELVRVVADIAQLNCISLGSLPLTNTTIQSLAVRDGHILFTTAGSEVCELVGANSLQQKTQGEKEWRLQVYMRGHATGNLCGLAVHPCKQAQFATAGYDGVVRLWDAATRSLLGLHSWETCELTGGSGSCDELRALAFSADGKHLAVGTNGGVVRVLAATLSVVTTQWRCWQDQRQDHAVLTLQYSIDGKLLAVGCQDGTVHVYNATSYRKITMLRGSMQLAAFIRLDFARDRPVLRVQCNRTGEQEILFWELGSWRNLPPGQMRDSYWESKRHPSFVSGTTQSDNFNGAAKAEHGHSTPVTTWAITKNKQFLLSTAGADRVVCQFRLPPRC